MLLEQASAASPASASPVNAGGAGSGGPSNAFWRQLRQPPIAARHAVSMERDPGDAHDRGRRSHQREPARALERPERRARPAARPRPAASSRAAASRDCGKRRGNAAARPRPSCPAATRGQRRHHPPGGQPDDRGRLPGWLSRTRSARKPISPDSDIAAGAPSGAE